MTVYSRMQAEIERQSVTASRHYLISVLAVEHDDDEGRIVHRALIYGPLPEVMLRFAGLTEYEVEGGREYPREDLEIIAVPSDVVKHLQELPMILHGRPHKQSPLDEVHARLATAALEYIEARNVARRADMTEGDPHRMQKARLQLWASAEEFALAYGKDVVTPEEAHAQTSE